MSDYSREELEEGIRAMDSLLRKCEKARTSLLAGTSQWTTRERRMKAFKLAHSILSEKLAELAQLGTDARADRLKSQGNAFT